MSIIYLSSFWPKSLDPATLRVSAEYGDDGYNVTITFADGRTEGVGGTFNKKEDDPEKYVLYKTVSLLSQLLADSIHGRLK